MFKCKFSKMPAVYVCAFKDCYELAGSCKICEKNKCSLIHQHQGSIDLKKVDKITQCFQRFENMYMAMGKQMTQFNDKIDKLIQKLTLLKKETQEQSEKWASKLILKDYLDEFYSKMKNNRNQLVGKQIYNFMQYEAKKDYFLNYEQIIQQKNAFQNRLIQYLGQIEHVMDNFNKPKRKNIIQVRQIGVSVHPEKESQNIQQQIIVPKLEFEVPKVQTKGQIQIKFVGKKQKQKQKEKEKNIKQKQKFKNGHQNKNYVQYFNKGIDWESKKNYGKAIEYYIKANNLNQFEDSKLYNNLANCYFLVKDFKNAQKNYKHAIELDKTYYQVYYNLGDVYLEIGAFNEAFNRFQECILLLNQFRQKCILGKIEALIKLKDLNQAEKDFKLVQNKHSQEYQKVRFIYFDIKKQYVAARQQFQKLQRMNLDNPNIYFRLSEIYSNLKEYQMQLKCLEKLEKRFPQHVNYSERGQLYQNLKRYDQALNDFNKVISFNNNDENGYNDRGTLYFNTYRYKQAQEDYNKALSINQKFADAYYNRGVLYKQLSKYVQAQQDFESAIKFNSADPDYYHQLEEVKKQFLNRMDIDDD